MRHPLREEMDEPIRRAQELGRRLSEDKIPLSKIVELAHELAGLTHQIAEIHYELWTEEERSNAA